MLRPAMLQGKLSSEGQIVVPPEVLERLNIRPGDQVEFVFDEGRGVRLEPRRRPLSEFYGILGRGGGPGATVDEMDEAVRSKAVADEDRILRGEA